jgi:hypothetical protein
MPLMRIVGDPRKRSSIAAFSSPTLISLIVKPRPCSLSTAFSRSTVTRTFGHPSRIRTSIFISALFQDSGTPKPAARSTTISGPRPEQQPASSPLIATAGTDRTPSAFARSATFDCFISSTVTTHDGEAVFLISVIISSQHTHPALKASIFRFGFGIFHSPSLRIVQEQDSTARRGHAFQVAAVTRTPIPVYMAGFKSK